MKGAGLTVGGFYAHFASKDALVDATLAQTSTVLRERLFAGLGQKPAGDRAIVVLKRYLSAAHRDDLERGCPFPAVVGEVGSVAPQHAEALAKELEALVSELAAHLPKEHLLGRRTLAIGLVALMFGGISLSRAFRGTPLSEEILKSCRAFAELALGGKKKESR